MTSKQSVYTLREAWLQALKVELEPVFRRVSLELGHCRMSVAPMGRKTLGVCYPPEHSQDQTCEIFIGAQKADPLEVAGTVVHELIHFAVGNEHGHKGPFRTKAKALGLEGKMTTLTIGPELRLVLESIIGKLGSYPHAVLEPRATAKRNKNRHQKLICRHCEYHCRSSRGAVEEFGAPAHCQDEPMVWADEDGEADE